MRRNAAASRRKPIWISQNFLTCSKTIKRLIDRTNLCKSDYVIEIGPGKGHITRQLAVRCKKVTAVEKDSRFSGMLYKRLECPANLNVVNMDFLRYRLPKGSYKIFSNIPFSHTSAVIRKITCSSNPPDDMWLVLEKGAAQRHMGIPYDTKASGMCKDIFSMNIIYYFSRNDFHPKPSVDTVLVHFSRK